MKRKRVNRVIRCLLCGGLPAAAGIVCFNVLGCLAVQNGGTSVPRDPASGLMLGADPICVDRGRRRACLLFHGWLSTPADFGELPEALDAAGWDVYVPLLVGHGTGPADMKGVTAEHLLEGARGHYRGLRERYDEVALGGFSMGGAIATVLAAEHPPDRLVLVAPFCGLRYKWYYVLPPRWWHAVASPVTRYVWRGKFRVRINQKENRDRVLLYTAFPTSASRALFALRRRLLEQTDLAGLTMPVLLVYSAGDDVCSPPAMEEFFGRIPSPEKAKAVFTRSNHHLLHDYEREAAAAAIVDFLAGQVLR